MAFKKKGRPVKEITVKKPVVKKEVVNKEPVHKSDSKIKLKY